MICIHFLKAHILIHDHSRLVQKHWFYVGLCRLSNDLILAQRFEKTLDRYWQRHAGLSMASGW